MTDTLINALIKAQQEIDHVIQDAKNPFFSSDYASLKNVIDSVKKPLNDNGIYLQQISHECERGACVETIFFGYGGRLSTGKVSIPANKKDSQAFGSALSYAKRYSLLMACGIASQKEDDDGEKAMQRNQTKPSIKYEYKNLKGTTVQVANTPVDYLEVLRGVLKDPEDTSAQALYKVNTDDIRKALEKSDPTTAKSFQKLIDLYESYEG